MAKLSRPTTCKQRSDLLLTIDNSKTLTGSCVPEAAGDLAQSVHVCVCWSLKAGLPWQPGVWQSHQDIVTDQPKEVPGRSTLERQRLQNTTQAPAVERWGPGALSLPVSPATLGCCSKEPGEPSSLGSEGVFPSHTDRTRLSVFSCEILWLEIPPTLFLKPVNNCGPVF